MGLGCGNAQTLAALQPGETLLDLGGGGGFDCFLGRAAGRQNGRAIGADMTPDMVSKARASAAWAGARNVEFPSGRDRAPAGRRRAG